MSKRLTQCSSYIKLLLSGNRIQSEAILVTATDKQVDCRSEILRNVLRLPVTKKTQDLIRTHNKLLQSLGDKKIPVSKRLQLIQRSHGKILDVLMSIKSVLLPLL